MLIVFKMYRFTYPLLDYFQKRPDKESKTVKIRQISQFKFPVKITLKNFPDFNYTQDLSIYLLYYDYFAEHIL